MATKLSNYYRGFPQGLAVRNQPLFESWAGNVFYVCNASGRSGSDSGKGTRDRPFSTLDYAVGRCTASNNDVIYIMPGHAETVTGNTMIALDVAGITIIGLGSGSDRPTFTFTTANTNRIAVSANNISIENCIFVGNFLSIATCFLLTTASDFVLNGNEFRDTDATHGFLSIVTTTVSVTSDGLTYTNNIRQAGATTTPGPDLVIANTMARLTVMDNTSIHSTISNNVAALIEHGALVMTHLRVLRNLVYSVNTDTASGAILVKTTATTGSGMIANNRIRALDTAAALLVPAACVQYGLFDNTYVGEGTSVSGFLLPAADTDA